MGWGERAESREERKASGGKREFFKKQLENERFKMRKKEKKKNSNWVLISRKEEELE